MINIVILQSNVLVVVSTIHLCLKGIHVHQYIHIQKYLHIHTNTYTLCEIHNSEDKIRSFRSGE